MPSSEFSEKRPILLLAFAAFASSSSMRVCDPLLPALATSFAASRRCGPIRRTTKKSARS